MKPLSLSEYKFANAHIKASGEVPDYLRDRFSTNWVHFYQNTFKSKKSASAFKTFAEKLETGEYESHTSQSPPTEIKGFCIAETSANPIKYASRFTFLFCKCGGCGKSYLQRRNSLFSMKQNKRHRGCPCCPRKGYSRGKMVKWKQVLSHKGMFEETLASYLPETQGKIKLESSEKRRNGESVTYLVKFRITEDFTLTSQGVEIDLYEDQLITARTNDITGIFNGIPDQINRVFNHTHLTVREFIFKLEDCEKMVNEKLEGKKFYFVFPHKDEDLNKKALDFFGKRLYSSCKIKYYVVDSSGTFENECGAISVNRMMALQDIKFPDGSNIIAFEEQTNNYGKCGTNKDKPCWFYIYRVIPDSQAVLPMGVGYIKVGITNSGSPLDRYPLSGKTGYAKVVDIPRIDHLRVKWEDYKKANEIVYEIEQRVLAKARKSGYYINDRGPDQFDVMGEHSGNSEVIIVKDWVPDSYQIGRIVKQTVKEVLDEFPKSRPN